MLNRICAHPEIIACTLGACALDAALYSLLREAPPRAVAPDWQSMLYFWALAVPAATALGCLMAMFTFYPLTILACSRINGAPLKPGDRAMVLCGPHKGIITDVYEITVGQGGSKLVRLDLGAECRERFRDIFEEWRVLKIRSGRRHETETPGAP